MRQQNPRFTGPGTLSVLHPEDMSINTHTLGEPSVIPGTPTAQALSGAAALAARLAGQALRGYEMSWPQAMSLLVLRARPGPTNASRLVDDLGLGRTAMTSVVDRLAQRGWIDRRPHPHDRRMILIELSPAGRVAADAASASLDTAFADHGTAPYNWDGLHGGLEHFIGFLRTQEDPASVPNKAEGEPLP